MKKLFTFNFYASGGDSSRTELYEYEILVEFEDKKIIPLKIVELEGFRGDRGNGIPGGVNESIYEVSIKEALEKQKLNPSDVKIVGFIPKEKVKEHKEWLLENLSKIVERNIILSTYGSAREIDPLAFIEKIN